MNILIFSNNIKFEYESPEKLKNWINNTIIEENFITKDINIIFTSDIELLKINNQFLNRDNYTDVIAFDYVENKNISGEIYISIERVKDNALKFNTTFLNELNRVIIHAILHLIGYKDALKSDKNQMTEKENYYLTKI